MDFHSDGSADPAGTVEYLLGPDTGASCVSHDMEGIFGAARPFPVEEVLPNSRAISPIVARAPNGRTGQSAAGRMLALSGLVITGVVAASVFVAQHRASNLTRPQIAIPLPPLASQTAPADRVPAPVQLQPVPAAPASLAGVHATKTAVAPASRSRPGVAVHHPKRPSTQHLARKPSARVHRSRREAELAAAPVASAPSSPTYDACSRLGGLDLARCMRPQILDADQKLRNAYHDATQAGVDRRELSAYRHQWSKLRNRANSDPRGVDFGYRQMAKQLEAARTGRPADGN